MNILKCEYCGEYHNGTYGSGRFCSPKCARKYSNTFVTEEGRNHQIEVLNDPENRIKNNNIRREASENFILTSDNEWIRIKPNKNKIENVLKNKFNHSLSLGKIGELTVIKKFLEHGFAVYTPVVDINGVDLVVRYDHISLNIQVKSSTMSKDVIKDTTLFSLYKIYRHYGENGTYKDEKIKYGIDEVDYFALYDVETDDIFLVENNSTIGKSISIRKRPSDKILGKQEKNIHMYYDYQFDYVIQNIKNDIKQSSIIDMG